MTRALVTGLVAFLLSFSVVAHAQLPPFPGAGPGLPVYDMANHLQNFITAVQSVLIEFNQLIELTALDSLVLEGDFTADLEALEALVEDGTALGWDIDSLQSQVLVLFDLGTAPTTSLEYRERQLAINQALFQGYSYAMRTQTLIRTALRTVQHIAGILEQVAGAIGNLTISQSIGQSQAKLQQLLTESNMQRAAFERAQSLEGAAPGVLLQGLYNINEAIMAGHPR
jgi:conjugal transfer/entry exclusion protein